MGRGEKVIYIAGEAVPVPNLPEEIEIITFKKNPQWSFYAKHREHPENAYYRPRHTKEFKEARSIKELKELVDLVILHADVTVNSEQCFNVLAQKGYSTHFMIDWNGTIYQALDVKDIAFHAEKQNARSIGIDLNNIMVNLLDRDYEDNQLLRMVKGKFGYVNNRNDEYYRPVFPPMKINGALRQTYGYTDAQYQALIALLKVLCDRLGIPKQFPANERSDVIPVVLEDEGFSGIAAHWHFKANRWDPGPSFDWVRMVAGLNNENNSFPIILTPGRNISNLLRRDRVREEAEKFYKNTEENEYGGYYPIGLHQNWHDGIHLHIDQPKTKVLNMVDGKIVALHFSEDETDLGSNNFILMRHEIPIPSLKKMKKKKKNIFKFYSLYMHLAPVKLSKDTDEPSWVSKLFKKADELGFKIKNTEPKTKRRDDISRYYLDWGYNLQDLINGKAVILDEDWDIGEIPAGTVLGYVGNFGEPGEREPLIHVEIFADDTWLNAVDMNEHGIFWYMADEDLKSDLICDSEDLLSMMIEPEFQYRLRDRREKQVILSPTDISSFYQSDDENFLEARKIFRKAIVRHISEWSDQVDWLSTISGAEKWDEKIESFKNILTDAQGKIKRGKFIDLIKRFLPFVWLTKDVAKAVGIERDPWDGVLYFFHPIYFLDWLTFRSARRIQTLSSGLSYKELKKRYEEELKKLELQKEGKVPDELREIVNEGTILPEIEVFEESPEEVFDEIRELKKFPDEWRMER